MDPNEKGQDHTDQTLTDAVSQDSFEAAFADFTGEGGGDDREADRVEGVSDHDEPARDAVDDPWSSVPEDLRAAHKAAVSELEQYKHRASSDAGRASAFQRKAEQLEKELADLKKAPAADGAAGEAAQEAQEFLEDPEFAAFREEYPEVAKPIEKVIKTLQAKAERLEREFGVISGDRHQQQIAKQEELLTQLHPDWKAATASPQFVQWYQSAPPGLRADIERHGDQIGDAQEVAKILDVFKAATGFGASGASRSGVTNLSAKRQRQLESAAAPAGRGVGPSSGAPDDFESAFNHFARKNSQSR